MAKASKKPAAAETPLVVVKDERKAIAKRLWINDNGLEVENVEDATGVSYQFVGRTKKGVTIAGDDEPFVVYFRDMSPKMLEMLAGFGAHTLMGNVTNTWLTDKSLDRVATAYEAVKERFDLLQTGKWVDYSGRIGAAVDYAALASAWIEVATSAGKEVTKTPAELEEILRDKPDMVKSLRTDARVTAAYARLRGAAAVDAADLLAGLE